jgi:hypothetical protein
MRALAAAAFVALVNFFVLSRWISLEFTDERASIEWAYLGLARHFATHGWATIVGPAEWFPYWYNGIPFENSYPPLLHVLVALKHSITPLSIGHSYHLVCGILFAAGPVGLLFLIRHFTQSLGAGLVAALAYSVLSPASWLMPDIARDLSGYFFNQRINVLSRWGEGPHIASLGFYPFALLAVSAALQQPHLRRTAIAALACAAVPLSNFLGGMALAWGVLAVLAAHHWKNWPVVLKIGAWAYLLSLRWLQPATIADIQRNAQIVGGVFPMQWWRYAALAALALAVIAAALWLQRRQASRAVILALTLTIPMATFPLAFTQLGYYFLPQPHRYHLEMEFALALLLAAALAKLPSRWLVPPALALCAFTALHGRAFDTWISPLKMRESWQYRVVHWMANQDPEARVYFQGSTRYFAGIEQPLTQFGGGFANGVRHPLYFLADYGITTNVKRPQETLNWLKAYGIDYVLVGGPNTSEPYKPWHDPNQFRHLLPEAWREGDDVIYRTGHAHQSLAHIIPADSLITKPPVYLADTAQLDRYVAAMEGPKSNGGVFTWANLSKAWIEGDIRPSDVVSVQIAYDPRWRATQDNRPIRTSQDALGQMVLHPTPKQATTITLEYHSSRTVIVLCAAAWIALIAALFTKPDTAPTPLAVPPRPVPAS